MKDKILEEKQLGAINILRFLAAFFVLMYHYTFMFYNRGLVYLDFTILRMFFKYGYLGVPLFFIISGFVISLSAENKDFKQFFISRIVRLYPTLWLASTLTFVSFLFFGEYHYANTGVSIVTYIMNLTMVPTLFNYPLIDGSYWTLAVELKFYAFAGLLLLFNLFKYISKLIPVGVFVLVAGILLEAPYNSASYFLSGVLFYDIYKNGYSNFKGFTLYALYAVSLYYQTLLSAIQNTGQEISISMLSVGLYITAFYIIFLAISLRIGYIKNSKIITVLGALTYPVYLLHQEIGAMLFSIQSKFYGGHVSLVVTIFFIMLLAYILYMYAEHPLQKILRNSLNKILSKK